MFAAGAGGDLVGLVGERIFAIEFFGDGGAQFGQARGRRVLGLTFVERGFRGVFDEGGGVEIGLARAEADDVDSGLLHGVCFGAHGQRDGIGDYFDSVGKRNH